MHHKDMATYFFTQNDGSLFPKWVKILTFISGMDDVKKKEKNTNTNKNFTITKHS